MQYQTQLARGAHAVECIRGEWTVKIDSMNPLRAPSGTDGRPRKYLPCECCGTLVSAPMRVVSMTCSSCLAPCPHVDCGLKLHEHYGPSGEECPCEPV